MAGALVGIGVFILIVTALGLFQVLRADLAIERMMAVQLLGTGGAAVLLLVGAASGTEATSDVALLIMLFAAFSCTAFTLGQARPPGDEDREDGP